MPGFAQPEDRFRPSHDGDTEVESNRSSEAGANKPKLNRSLDEPELDSALQLLVERAQYITGATGTALALPQGKEMVCRASAGSSAPVVGARLQVLSGLTGESISRRQLLRCDNAETDPRVNLEACRALGIASIVVLPLFRRNGEVRGLIELFSDHAYAFEERDLVALERMADLTLTALDLAEQQNSSAVVPPGRRELENPVESSTSSSREPLKLDAAEPGYSSSSELAELQGLVAPRPAMTPLPAAVPEAMRRIQKCASCGFPISGGRTLCLDCEKKTASKNSPEKQREKPEEIKTEPAALTASATVPAEEFVPAFLANAASVQKPWISNPIGVLAILVLIVAILVAYVVFR